MTVLNVGLMKVHAERFRSDASQVKVQTNVAITSVEKLDMTFGGAAKQPVARFLFEFKVDYEPKVGEILLQGDVLFVDTKEKIESLVSDWKKNKRTNPETTVSIINKVLNKAQIEALILSKEIGLPLPIQLPRVTPNSKKNQ